jgi:cytochrome c-type biogenesis protein CcmE
MRLKTGAILSTLVAFLATGGIAAALILNASPYMSIDEAKHSGGRKINVVGDIDKQTLVNNAAANTITFDLVDPNKDRIKVVYTGATPANMGNATRVVVIGEFSQGKLLAKELRIKCPSKYEAQESR